MKMQFGKARVKVLSGATVLTARESEILTKCSFLVESVKHMTAPKPAKSAKPALPLPRPQIMTPTPSTPDEDEVFSS